MKKQSEDLKTPSPPAEALLWRLEFSKLVGEVCLGITTRSLAKRMGLSINVVRKGFRELKTLRWIKIKGTRSGLRIRLRTDRGPLPLTENAQPELRRILTGGDLLFRQNRTPILTRKLWYFLIRHRLTNPLPNWKWNTTLLSTNAGVNPKHLHERLHVLGKLGLIRKRGMRWAFAIQIDHKMNFGQPS